MFHRSNIKAAISVALTLISVLSHRSAQASAIAYIDSKNQKFIVQSQLYFYGPLVTFDVVKRSVAEIRRMWNEPKVSYFRGGKEYPIEFQIDYSIVQDIQEASPPSVYTPTGTVTDLFSFNRIQTRVREILSTNPGANGIQIAATDPQYDNRSNYMCGGQNGKFIISDDLGKSTTSAHEYGHGLGLGHVVGDICKGPNGPSIMCARGSITLPEYQYNPNAEAGKEGGTLNPYSRKVIAEDILALELPKIPANEQGIKIVGPHLRDKCSRNRL